MVPQAAKNIANKKGPSGKIRLGPSGPTSSKNIAKQKGPSGKIRLGPSGPSVTKKDQVVNEKQGDPGASHNTKNHVE